VRRSTAFAGYNADEAVSLAKSRVDGIAGLASLALGFLCQAVAYVIVVGGKSVPTGGRPAIGAGLAAILAAISVFVIWRAFRRRALLRVLIEAAHYEPRGRYRLRWPSGQRLAQYAFALDEFLQGEEKEQAFVKRVFGVDNVGEAFQGEDLPPPEAFEDD
jgi:hypothetical protein